MKRILPRTTFTASYADTCADCYGPIDMGDQVAYLNTDLVCLDCFQLAVAERDAQAAVAEAGVADDIPVSGDDHAFGHKNHFKLRPRNPK